MALIHIRRRQEPITISDERARILKDRKFGNEIKHVQKAEPSESVDLGEWAGEYGEIRAIDIPPRYAKSYPETPKNLTPEERENVRKILDVRRPQIEKILGIEK